MFSNVLEQVKGFFGQYFVLAFFFPTLAFVGLNVALAIEVTQGLETFLARWEKIPLATQAILLAAALALVIALAYILYNFQYSIVRLFEGYWLRVPLLRRLAKGRVDLHHARWMELKNKAATEPENRQEYVYEQLTFYPPPTHLDKIMPTRLGNILRASEIYAFERYGIDSTIIWTRLHPLLKPEVVTALEHRKMARDFMLLAAFFSALFTAFWAPILILFTNRGDLFLAVMAGWILAWLFYENAVQSSVAYGEQVKVIFDLYRGDLLKALDRSVTPETEAKEWKRLGNFFYRNLPLPKPPVQQEKTPPWDRVANALENFLQKQDTNADHRNEEYQ